jgi:hypothetical protein
LDEGVKILALGKETVLPDLFKITGSAYCPEYMAMMFSIALLQTLQK